MINFSNNSFFLHLFVKNHVGLFFPFYTIIMRIQFFLSKIFLLTILISILFPFINFAQKGSPYITNYDLNNQYKFRYFDILQDVNQIMFFAGQKGVLSFDGNNWELISTPGMPLTMYSDTVNDKIYVGCENDVGYIEKNNRGDFIFRSIKKMSLNTGKIIEIYLSENRLIVLSNEYITIFDAKNYQLVKQISSEKEKFSKIINYSDAVFIIKGNNKFYKLKDDSLYSVRIKNKKNIGKILFDFSLSKKRTVIGTTNNQLYFFGGKSVWHFNIQDQKYLDESVLLNAIQISDSKIAVSTLLGGILIIDTKTRKTIKNINYSSGLPDNEIYAIGKDDNNGLWISHALGISRIDFSIPVKFYNTYPGLKGRLLSVINFNNTVYAGTGEGLFFLEELDEHKRARLIESEISVISKDLKTEKQKKAKEDAKKKGIFSGLHKKIKNFISPDNTIQLSERKKNSLIRKRKLLGMQSLSHSYKKIEGIDDRCKHLVAFEDKLLVGGNKGVYIVEYEEDERIAKKIIYNRYVNAVIPDKINPTQFFICSNKGLSLLKYSEDEWKDSVIEMLNKKDVFSVLPNDTSVWVGTNNDVLLINTEQNTIKKYEINNKYADPILVQEFENKLYFLLSSEILFYNEKKDSIIPLISSDLHFIKTQPDVLWIKENKSWKSVIQPKNFSRKNNIYLNLFDGIEYIYIDKKNNTWYIDNKNNLLKISNSENNSFNVEQTVFIKNITNESGDKFPIESLFLDSDENYIRVSLSAPFYIKQNAVEYRYFLEGLMKKWSMWSNEETFSFPFVPHGNYMLHVKAKNIFGNVSKEKKISFSIKEAFWEKDWFLISSGIGFLIFILLIIRLRERKLQKNKKLLEKKIKERTKTIEEQKNQIAKSHQNIKDSITYAKRIQEAIMPSKKTLDKSFSDYFIFFKPRDIVSGDFYWLKQISDYTVYAVADCTGHGVPGALLSMLGISFLSEIVSKARFDTPDEILNRLRKKIKSSLKQTEKGIESKDGMDIALCVIDHDSLQLQFAGAYNPIYIIRKGELTEIKATRNPIGAFLKEKPFESNKFKLEKDDLLYTFSDGYSDQFGQNENQKFNKRNFKKLLLKIYDKPMSEQKEILDDVLKKWKGKTDQTDDIIVMGVRI